jgi:hypothetical protein
VPNLTELKLNLDWPEKKFIEGGWGGKNFKRLPSIYRKIEANLNLIAHDF